MSINQDTSLGDIVKTGDKANDGAFTGTGGPDQRHRLSRRNMQVNIMEDFIPGS